MSKRWTIILTMAAFFLAALHPSACLAEDLDATVVKVIDGDTIKVTLAGPMPELFRHHSVRLLGCDTPEKRDKRLEVAVLARMATDFTASLIHPGDAIELQDIRFDKYGGRILAHVAVDGHDLCAALIAHDPPLAKPYEGGRKEW